MGSIYIEYAHIKFMGCYKTWKSIYITLQRHSDIIITIKEKLARLKNTFDPSSRAPHQTESIHTTGARLKVKDTFGIRDIERMVWGESYSRANSDGIGVAKLLLRVLLPVGELRGIFWGAAKRGSLLDFTLAEKFSPMISYGKQDEVNTKIKQQEWIFIGRYTDMWTQYAIYQVLNSSSSQIEEWQAKQECAKAITRRNIN